MNNWMIHPHPPSANKQDYYFFLLFLCLHFEEQNCPDVQEVCPEILTGHPIPIEMVTKVHWIHNTNVYIYHHMM